MNKLSKFTMLAVVMLTFIFAMSLQTFAATINLFDNLTIENSAGTGSGDATKYTATVSASFWSSADNTITLNNTASSVATIAFSYTVSGQSSFTIGGQAVSNASGNYTTEVVGGGTLDIVLSVKASSYSKKTATLTLENFTYILAPTASNVTVEFDSALCTVTAGGAAITSGSTITIEETAGVEIDLVPLTDATFFAWVDQTGKIMSRSTKYTQESLGDKTITPLFSKDNTPYFMVDNTYLLSDLNIAAQTGNNIVLICDGTLPAGNYTIPAGTTLLIPFDAENTLYTAEPPGVSKADIGGYTQPEEYRTLTMASGANITVEGSISLSAKHFAAGGSDSNSGSPIGNVSFIRMQEHSSITVENGGKLYAWGYITGDGAVSVKSGAEVFEYFQVTDFRGGTQTMSMKNGVFLFSQYYIQNIEVPMTVYAGAKETTRTSVCMFGTTVASSSVNFFGQTNAMFNLTDGYVVKKYDGSTDRLIVELNGDMSISPVKMTISIYTVDSSQYELPVNSNITINVKGGSNAHIEQDLCLLPGSVINIEEGANGTLKSGSSIYVYDADEWAGYCSPSSVPLRALTFVPGRTYTRTVADLVDAKVNINGNLDLSEGYVYTTQGKAEIVSDGTGKIEMIQGVEKATYQLDQANSTYAQIPITTAQLKNADGTYTNPEDLGDCCSIYAYSDGKWEPESVNHTAVTTTPAVEPTCTEEGKTEGSYCSACNTVIKEQETVPVLGHTYGGWAEVDENNHSKSCACGDTVTAAHSWDSGVVTTPATCKGTGIKTFACAGCGATKTEEIPADADNHTFVGINCSACGLEKIVTGTTYTINNDDIIISTTLVEEVSDDTQITFATFDLYGRLLGIVQGTAATLKEASLPSAGVEMIKIYAWDGVKVMTPVSGVEEIEL